MCFFIVVQSDHIAFGIHDPNPQMRCDQFAAINDSTDCPQHLNRCDLKRLSKGNRRKFHIPHIVNLMHDRTRLSREINAALFHKSKPVKILVHYLNTGSKTCLDKNRIARIHQAFHKGFRAMSADLVTSYPSVIDNLISRAVKTVIL